MDREDVKMFNVQRSMPNAASLGGQHSPQIRSAQGQQGLRHESINPAPKPKLTLKLLWRARPRNFTDVQDDSKLVTRVILSKAKNLWRGKRAKRVAISVVTLVVITTVLIHAISPAAAAVTVATSTASGATSYSQQRKTWYDGTRYWASFFNGTSAVFYYSTNGTTWTQDSSATITTFVFSIEADQSNAFIAYLNGNNVEARQATSYPGTGFAWGSATVVETDTNGVYSPQITRDSSNKVVITWGHATAGSNDAAVATSTAANSVASFNSPTIIGAVPNVGGESSATMANGHIFSAWDNGTKLQGEYYNGSAWDSTSLFQPIASIAANASYSQTIGSGSEAYMSYVNSSGNTILRKYEDSSGVSSSKINDAGNPGAISGTGRAVVRTSTGTLYSFIKSSGTCGIWKSTDEGASWAEQDSAHHPTCSGAVLAMAIDSTDKLHLAYYNGGTNMVYNTMSSDTFGTAENVTINSTISTLEGLDIAVDSNDVPHMVFSFLNSGGSPKLEYSNRVGGTWDSAPASVRTGTLDLYSPSLTIDKDNKAEVCSIDDSGNGLATAVGNLNDATSFTSQTLDTSVNTTGGTLGCQPVVDSSGNTWVTYVDSTGTNQINLIKHNYGDAWTTWQTAVTDTKTGSEPSLAVAGNMMYLLYKNSTGAIARDIYNGDTASWGGEVVIQSGTTLQDTHVRWAYNADNQNEPLDYLYSDGTDIYYNQTGVWRAPVTLDSNSGNAYTAMTRDTTTGNLYITWERSNVIYYKKCVSPYLAANCDASATTKYTGGTTVAWLSTPVSFTSTSCVGSISLIWTEGAGSPYNVKYDPITLNCPPNTPTLSSPSSGSTVITTTPALQMSATDPESDTLKYKVFIYNTSANDGTTCTGSSYETGDQTSSGTGWDNGTTAYTSGATATYTVQTAMTRGNAYCWQAQAIDPGGSNTFGSLSSPSTFTINQVPSAPTLTKPVSGETGVNTTPEFRLYSTDQDSDYLRYEIILYDSNCSTQTQAGTGTFDENSSQTGWSSQNLQSGTAYSSGQTAIYRAQTALTANTQYCWKAAAKDPGGSNTFGSFSSTQLFTTLNNSAPKTVRIGGSNVNIGGNVTIKP